MTQAEVDEVRLRVTLHWVRGLLLRGYEGALGAVNPRHIWFPKNDISVYQMRTGNAPAPRDRPRHLRKLELWLNPELSTEMLNFIRPGGTLDEKIDEYLQDTEESDVIWLPREHRAERREVDPVKAHAYRVRLIAKLCAKMVNPVNLQ